MRTLLGVTIVTLMLIVTFAINFNVGPGLSVKNIFIYLPAAALATQIILGLRLKTELRHLHACFWVLILYAAVSVVVAAYAADYRNYGVLPNIIYLKGMLFDWWVLFAVFFYSARTTDDVERLIKVLLLCLTAANLATLLQLGGLINLGHDVIGDEFGESSRVYGVFGHSNETAALIVCLIPAYIAIAESQRGLKRGFWIGCMMISVTMLVLTASRGALAGLLVGGVWAAFWCRRYLSMRHIMKWVWLTAAALVPMLLIVGVKYWDQLMSRFQSDSSAGVRELTSGRTDIWTEGFGRMIEYPWTFITGFGWNSWAVQGFIYIPHMEYLSFWFELGLVGLVTFILILVLCARTAFFAAARADASGKRLLIALVFAIHILGVTMIFATLFIPWLFLWPYIGLCMRYAVIVMKQDKPAVAAPVRARVTTVPPQMRPRVVPAAGGSGATARQHSAT